MSFLCVHFTFWVACSPVWNSKDTLKLPLLAVCSGLCASVWLLEDTGWGSVCWPVLVVVVAALGFLLNWLWQDRTLVLSAPLLSCWQASCNSQLVDAAAAAACGMQRVCLWVPQFLSLYALPAPRCRHVVARVKVFFCFSPPPLLYFIVVSFGSVSGLSPSQSLSVPRSQALLSRSLLESKIFVWINF